MRARKAARALFALACDPGIPIENQVLKTACGSCIFKMKDAVNCPFAVEIDGKHYLVQGAVPQDHNSHMADGICNMAREARITGVLRDGKLIASSFELLPAEYVPDAPAHHDHSHDHDH